MGQRNTKKHIGSIGDVEDFRVVRTLGEGSYGTVKWVTSGNGKQHFALKIMKKKRFFRSRDNSRLAWAERNNMIECNDSPFIVSLERAFQSDHHIYLVTPLYGGGDLMSRLNTQYVVTPEAILFYLAESIIALEYLHSKNICHRDIKPENIFLDDEGHVVLGDLGLSIKTSAKNKYDDSHYWGQCGSYGYRAPEVIQDQSCGFPADIYALGITFYYLTFGDVIWAQTANRLAQENATGKSSLVFPAESQINDLLTGMLDVNPATRFTSETMKQHSSFDGVDWNAIAARNVAPPWVPGTQSQIKGTKYRQTTGGEVDWPDRKFKGFEYNALPSSVVMNSSDSDNSLATPPTEHRRLGQVVSTPPTKHRHVLGDPADRVSAIISHQA